MTEEFNITKHSLVAEHIKLSDEEKKSLLEEHNIKVNQLPMILKSDIAIQHLEPEIEDVIKIVRDSPTNVKQAVFRVVVHG
jgi:DNA-directed RNA polymerases I, II, and III subunit RPABC1